ncbi:hypothetical protein I317_06384 [Kwoniella heveanensis CBS 569]|nr:hypothetical protein I317_06384 [Kwoniella heveanensis CBS 569]
MSTQARSPSPSLGHPSSHSYSQGHSRNASSYTSAEAGRPSNLGGSGGGLTQRSPSPSPTKPTFGFNDPVPLPMARSTSSPGPSGPMGVDRSLSGTGLQLESGGWKGLTPQRIGRAIGARFMRAVRRGNLPFLLVFFSCTIVFFSALAGVGYHEPLDTSASVPGVPNSAGGAGGSGAGAGAGAGPGGSGEFRVGGPVFDEGGRGLERRIAEQRALEEAWAKKRRPKDTASPSSGLRPSQGFKGLRSEVGLTYVALRDRMKGAWMRKQRDDKAIRRRPTTATSTTSSSDQDVLATALSQLEERGDGGSAGLDKRDSEAEARLV